MFIQAYKSALATILRKPLMLWGLSLLSGILCIIATIVCGVLGFIGTAFAYVISVGMAKVYLDGLEGREVNSDQLFSGFNKRIFRIAGGMAWKDLWTVIWTLAVTCVPFIFVAIFAIIGLSFISAMGVFTIIGLVLGCLAVIPAAIYYISKIYSYAFVPYILATKPDVTATQALRLSMELTKGKKLQMWLADFLYSAIVSFITVILTLLGLIPYIGFLFKLILLVWTIILIFFGPLFKGLYAAEFYRIKPMPKAPKMNPYAGTPYGGHPQGYQQAPQGYQQAPQGYQQAPQGYQQAPQGYQQAPQGYQQAPQGYQQAPQGYQQAPQGYQQAPQQGYNPMNNQ